MTSTAGSLTPETVDLGTDLEESDGQESRRSRSYRGSAIVETPRHPKRIYAIVPAPIVQSTVPKVLYLQKITYNLPLLFGFKVKVLMKFAS